MTAKINNYCKRGIRQESSKLVFSVLALPIKYPIITFLKKCSSGETLKTVTSAKTVVVGCKDFCYYKSSLLCQTNFISVITLSQGWGKSGHPQFWIYYCMKNLNV